MGIDTNDFAIDRDSLDLELEKQPSLYFYYAEKLAASKLEYEQEKQELEAVKAQLYMDMVSNPDKYDLGKTTEKAIEMKIATETRYKKVQKRLIELKGEVDALNAAIVALDHKKKALESLTSLWIGSYWSEPNLKGDREVVEERSKKKARNKAQKGISK